MTAAEERKRVLERRLGFSKAHGVWVSAVFFVLTSLGVAAMFGMAKEMRLPEGWVAAILSIALAEYLIRRLGFWQTGVESALWTGGLFAFIFGLPGKGKPEALLLFAVACAIAGRRVRNPLIGTCAAIFVIAYFGAKDWYEPLALLCGIATAVFALAARAGEWQRPTTDALFVVLLLVCPVAGSIAAYRAPWWWGAAYVGLAVTELLFGAFKRDRVALIAAIIAIVIATIEMHALFDFVALEWKLIGAGAVIFGAATIVSRALGGRTRGFVVTPVKNAYEEALRIFGTAAFAPLARHDAETAPQPVGSGGSFGGAGATGDY